MASRYRVITTPDQRAWVILDRELGGFCALPDDPTAERPNLLPLEWRSRHGADAWLHRCYMAWESWERNGTPGAPKEWRPLSDTPSPWATEPDRERTELPGFLWS